MKKKTVCNKCNTAISNCNYKRHSKRCDGSKKQATKKCNHCGVSWEELGCKRNEKGNHTRWCLANPKLEQYKENLKTGAHALALALGREKAGYSNQFTKAKRLGLEIPVSIYKGKPGFFKGKRHTDETKKKLREKQLISIANGKVIKAGRCKKYKHVSLIAGEITVDGTWELKFCNWADENNLQYKRNKVGFKYNKPDGKEAIYFPDFQLNENTFVEIKGYETELDRCKWNQFPYKLIVIKKEQLENLNINMFL